MSLLIGNLYACLNKLDLYWLHVSLYHTSVYLFFFLFFFLSYSMSSPVLASNSTPPPPAMEATSKRKQSSASSSCSSEDEERQETENPPTTPGPPPLVALPPPLLQYHLNGQFIPIVHPHQQAAFYYQQPIYYPISPQPQPETLKKTPRLLPKSPSLSPYFHPYNNISPTLVPNRSTADEREKARKVSHSAIERRRRERINDKIFQLKQLIPACVDQDNLHKMSILQSAIDYISYLKDIVTKLENNESTATLLKGDHLKVQKTKSMIPKEIEPYTTQFSVKTTTSSSDMSIQNILC